MNLIQRNLRPRAENARDAATAVLSVEPPEDPPVIAGFLTLSLARAAVQRGLDAQVVRLSDVRLVEDTLRSLVVVLRRRLAEVQSV